MQPNLIICCITYNHSPYIRQALESFLMQRTNFPFEIYISDDASTDSTPDILKEYAAKYPQKIKIFLHKKNQGVMQNFIGLLERISSKYVCLCEGDDYWTDPLKLQKQKNFLDNHPECSLVFHPVKIHWEDNSHSTGIWKPYPKKYYGELEQQILDENIIPTLSVMYRWRFNTDSLSLFPKDILPGDWFLHRLHAQVGKLGFIPEIMGVYRKHSGGVWYNQFNDKNYFINNFWPLINAFLYAEKQFQKDYTLHISEILYNVIHFSQRNSHIDLISLLRTQNLKGWNALLSRFCHKTPNPIYSYIRWKFCFMGNRKEYKRKYFFSKVSKFLQIFSKN